MSNTITYSGKITFDLSGDDCDALFVGGCNILSKLNDEIDGQAVSVKYYISEVELTEAQLLENSLMSLCGGADVEYEACYSEYTGYLYHSKGLQIGGHDLLEELIDAQGEYLHLIIEIHD